MTSLITFLNTFLSYFLLFGISVVLVIAAVFIGIKLRKNKNMKAVDTQETLTDNA